MNSSRYAGIGLALLALAVPGCIQLGLGGDSGAAAGSGDTGSTGSGDLDWQTYAVNGVMTSNSCGSVVAPANGFSNTADVLVDADTFTFAVGSIVATGTYTEDDREFDATSSSSVDLTALTGLQGTACELTRIDVVKGDFDGADAETFGGTLTVRYVPNDQALCRELLVDTWDATFSAIPCDVEYDIQGVKQ
jgi:hypothetical protein